MGFEPWLLPLSKALYHTCFICGQRCKWWSRRPKLTSSVISDVKPIIYICLPFLQLGSSNSFTNSLLTCAVSMEVSHNLFVNLCLLYKNQFGLCYCFPTAHDNCCYNLTCTNPFLIMHKTIQLALPSVPLSCSRS